MFKISGAKLVSWFLTCSAALRSSKSWAQSSVFGDGSRLRQGELGVLFAHAAHDVTQWSYSTNVYQTQRVYHKEVIRNI